MKKRLGKVSGKIFATAVALSVILVTSFVFMSGGPGWIRSQAASAATTYGYDPYFAATGSSYYDVPSSSSLQLEKFSVAAWFKTTQKPSDYAFIVNKDGLGVESAGENLNYGIWLFKSGRIHAGFEGSSGANYFVYSPDVYNDGNWHYVVLAYGGSRLSLYIDGQQVAYRDLQASPDSAGTQSVRVGANSYSLQNDFVGSIDEVRVYNRSVQPNEVSTMYSGTFSSSGQVLYLPFGTTTTATTAPLAPSGLTGSATSATTGSLLWNSVATATSYDLYRYSSEVATVRQVNTSPITSTSYGDGALVSGVTYYYYVTAVNQYGESGPSNTATISTAEPAPEPTPDTTVPVVVISTPAAGSTVTTSSVQVTGTASDNVGVTQVQGSIDGGSFTTATGTSSWSYAANNLVNGAHTVTIRASDAAGNVGTKSVTFTVGVSPPPSGDLPFKPTVIVSRTSSGTTVAKDATTGATISSGSNAATVINAAISYLKAKAAPRNLLIEPGTYQIPQPINVGSIKDFAMFGREGQRDNTKLVYSGSYQQYSLLTASSGSATDGGSVRNLDFSNLWLDGAFKSKAVVKFYGLGKVHMKNVIMERGASPSGPNVLLSRMSDTTLEYVIARNHATQGDLLGIGGWRIKVLHSEFVRSGEGVKEGGGLTSGGMVDSEFAYNYVHDYKGYGAISLEAQSSESRNVKIHDNVIERVSGKGIAGNTYSQNGHMQKGVEIYNNKLDRISSGGIVFGGYTFSDDRFNRLFTNFNIHDNQISNVGSSGIYCGPITDSVIRSNTITTVGGYGVRLYSNYSQDGIISDNVTITGNTITGTKLGKYYYSGSNDIYIDGSWVI